MVNKMKSLELSYNENGKYLLKDLSEVDANIVVPKDRNIVFDLDNNSNLNANFFINENANVTLRIFNYVDKRKIKIAANLGKNAVIRVYFADFSKFSSEFISNIVLLGEESKGEFKFTSLTKNESLKNYNLSFDHIGKRTYSNLEGYGVCENKSQLIVNGASHIEKDAIKSEAHQKIKAILFDKESKATANPILKIDNNDIIASHACAIGNLNEDHIFYLLSRGIDINEARKLITFGYLNPIKEHFDDEIKDEITRIIEEDI